MVRTHSSGDLLTVEVLGPLEAATVGALRAVVLDTIESTRPARLCVDLRRVPFMDSIGIGALVAINTKTRDVGGRMEVRRPSPFVHRLLQVTGLTEIFGLPELPVDAPVSGAGAPGLFSGGTSGSSSFSSGSSGLLSNDRR